MPEDATDTHALNKAKAVQLGLLVNVVYALFKLGNLTPEPAGLPAAYKFVAWVQMKDFSISSEDYQFYGLLVEEVKQPGSFVVAIRGTQGDEEWFDDVTALFPESWPGGGRVGYGFSKIYDTLRIVDPHAPQNTMGAKLAECQAGFAEQVERVTHRRMALAHGEAPPATKVTATGHSLGAALATLYASDNHRARYQTVELLCTFASPFVGDAAFAESFDALNLTSWRIVNDRDLVPMAPPLEYQHIKQLEAFNSGNETVSSILDPVLTIGCWHSLHTYLHLLDSTQPIETKCQPRANALSARRMALAKGTKQDVSVALPRDQATTINITINIGGPG